MRGKPDESQGRKARSLKDGILSEKGSSVAIIS